jgi:xylose dehydrogenase (NAD/NADP)
MGEMTDQVRFGFLGAGGIATRALAPAVHAAPHAKLQAVAARDADRATGLEPEGRVYTDYAALLADPDVEVVYIALNNDVHHTWTVAALEAGKHVLCEKPLGLDDTEVAAMTAAAAAADRLLVEAFMYRWHPRLRRVEQLLALGLLGAVRSVSAEFSFAGPADGDLATAYRLDPNRGGGALYDVGCYTLSASHIALGPRLLVDEVTTTVGVTGVDLALSARLHNPAGAVAEITCGIAAPDRQELRIVGEDATLELSKPVYLSWHSPSSLAITSPDGATSVEEFPPVDPYALMVDAVASRVRGEQAFVVGLDHSAHIARSISAIRRHEQKN